MSIQQQSLDGFKDKNYFLKELIAKRDAVSREGDELFAFIGSNEALELPERQEYMMNAELDNLRTRRSILDVRIDDLEISIADEKKNVQN